jgi:hypothetical protein
MPLVNVTERLRTVMAALEPAWEAAARRNAWFAASAAGGAAAAAARIALVWSTTEPFALSEPLHAAHNRNITHLNADARQVALLGAPSRGTSRGWGGEGGHLLTFVDHFSLPSLPPYLPPSPPIHPLCLFVSGSCFSLSIPAYNS